MHAYKNLKYSKINKHIQNFMKKLILITSLVHFSFSIIGQSVLEYSITPWLDNKRGVVTLSYDDNITSQYTIALPIMNESKYNYKATFFTITGNVPASGMGSWKYLREELTAKGHEVASHTVTHRNLNQLTNKEVTDELANSDKAIEENIPSVKCVSIAWPFGVGGDNAFVRSETSKYYIGARNAWGVEYNSGDVHDAWLKDITYRYNVSALGMNTNTNTATFKSQLQNVLLGKWVVLLFHGIDNGEYDGMGAAKFREFMEEINLVSKNAWIAPFGDVLKYNAEKFAQKFTADSENNKMWILSLTDTLKANDVYNFPLTIKLKKPTWNADSIYQGNKKLDFSLKSGYYYFNSIPDAGKIIIYKNDPALNVDNNLLHNAIAIYPNPENEVVTVLLKKKDIVEIFKVNGTQLSTLSLNEGENKIDVSRYSDGVYILKVGTFSQKITIQNNH